MFNVLESEEDNIMYSICTYMAENMDSLNLVEGEKVYVIGKLAAFFNEILSN